jgi:GxxExxY protein
MHADEVGVNRLSERIIGCVFRVLNSLGIGFLEKVYENALALELRWAGLVVAQQKGITAHYDDIAVGAYVVDPMVEGTIMVELKSIKVPDNAHAALCISCLKATVLQL